MLGAEEKGLELTCHTSSTIPATLVGDPARLRQVLVNLVHNAIKFTRVGEVTVRASVETETETEVTVRVEVRDTGIGIDPGAKGKLFRPFSQVDASTTRGYGGTGLGLAICNGLIERMNGHIGVESEPGAGSTFWLQSPSRSRAERGLNRLSPPPS